MHQVAASDGEISITHYGESDAIILYEVDGDPEHRKRFDFPDDFVPSVAHAKDIITSWARGHETGTRFAFAVRNAESGELLGGCELKPKVNGSANISYWVHPRHRRKGIASRTVKLLSFRIAPNYGFRFLEILTDIDNLASRGVAKNSGFTETGIKDGQVLHILTLQPAAQQGGQPDAFGAG